jgi:uncharacterized delta-60 repeat protein
VKTENLKIKSRLAPRIVVLLSMTIGIASLLTSVQAYAASTYHADSNVSLTLVQTTGIGTLGVNLHVRSAGEVDHDTRGSTGVGLVASTPVINGPAGEWQLNDTYGQATATGGTAGDTVGTVTSDLGTTGTITIENFSDAPETFVFSWTLSGTATVSQSGVTPTTDNADSIGEFSMTDDLGATLLGPMTVSANTLNPGLPGSSSASGTLSYTVQGGKVRTISIVERASGQASALDEGGTGLLPSDRGHAEVIQTDGKIVVAGYAYNGNDYDFALTRYNTDGSLDTSFGGDGKVTTGFSTDSNDYANGVALQDDGKIIAVGYTDPGANKEFALARYHGDGSPDASFGVAGKITLDFSGRDDVANAVAVQSGGNVIAAGYSFNGADNDFALARFDSFGNLDAGSFGTNGKVVTDFAGANDAATTIAIQLGVHIVIAGNTQDGADASTSDFAMVRYGIDGTVDAAFGVAGTVVTDFGDGGDVANALVVATSEFDQFATIVLAGYAHSGTQTDFGVARYLQNGSLDSSFGTNGLATIEFAGKDDQAFALARTPDGSLVVAGFADTGANQDFAIARLAVSGQVDGNFGSVGRVTEDFSGGDDQARAMAIQEDGKIVVSGWAVTVNADDFALLRIE